MLQNPLFARVKNVLYALIVGSLWLTIPGLAQTSHWLTGYYATYNYGVMSTSQLDYTKLTHVIYWPVIPNSSSPGTLNTTPFGLSPTTFANGATDLVTRAHAAGAKALIGIGGDQSSGATAGFQISTNSTYQATFIRNIVALMQQYGFDGVDINWEQIQTSDNSDFTSFIANLRAALNAASPNTHLLLTMPPETKPNGGRPDLLAQVYQDLDQINIQTYQMSGPYCAWETWYNSPLNNGGATFILVPSEQLPSITNAIADYTAVGIPQSLLAMGMQFDAEVWTGGQGTSTGGVTQPKQTWTGDNNNAYCSTSNPSAPNVDTLAYRLMITTLATTPGYTTNFDSTADQSWLSYDPSGTGTTNESQDTFVSFDSPTSIAKKGVDLSSMPSSPGVGGTLGGAFIFELSGDFASTAPSAQQHPLLNAAHSMQMLLPGLIDNLSVTTDSSSIRVSWPDATFTTSYNVSYSTTSGAIGTIINVPTNQAALTNLTPGQVYYIQVQPVNAIGTGAWTLQMSATFPSGPMTPRVVWIPDYYGGLLQVRVGTTPTAITINLPSCSPNSVAVNNNYAYVVCTANGSNPDKILVYDATTVRAAPGGTLAISPLQTITSSQFNSLIGIAFDSSNNLWVASYGNNQVDSISAATLNTSSPVVTPSLINSPAAPVSLTFDSAGGIWVVGQYVGGILLHFPSSQINQGQNANPDYCLATANVGSGCQYIDSVFLGPEGVALFNGDVWVSNNDTGSSGNVPGRELVDLKFSSGTLTVNETFGASGTPSSAPFVCPGGLFASPYQLWVNDESYGETNPQCGAAGDVASMTGGVFSFTPSQLAAKTTTISQVLDFSNVTGRPGFGGIFVENDTSSNLQPQTVTFNNLPSEAATGTSITLSATAQTSITFSSPSPSSICSVSGSTATFSGAGTCTVTATAAQSSVYQSASTSQNINVLLSQTITFGTIPPQAENSSVALNATASSGLTVTFTSTTTTFCTVSGSTATLLAPGTCSIKASQAGNSSYAAAAPVTQSFTVTTPSGLGLIPVTPCRVVDTRSATGALGGPTMTAGSTRSFPLPMASCGLPATASAYSLNVTVIPKTKLSYLTMWPTGLPQPVVSTLNSPSGTILANAAIVPAGTSGDVSVYVTDQTDVIIDVNGYFGASGSSGALTFVPLTPCRVEDTRKAAGSLGGPILAAGSSRSFPVPSSSCQVPASAAAYSLNATVVPTSVLHYLTLYPAGTSQPVVSTLNSYNGQVVANAAIVRAGTAGAIEAYVTDQTNLITDINGYFTSAPPTPLVFNTVTPCRVVDTRQASGPLGGPIMTANSTRTFPIPTSSCGIPSTATAYALNVTVVPSAALNYLTLWPAGETQPTVSTLNSPSGQTLANAALVPAGTSGSVDVFVTNQTHVLIDIVGYFSAP